MQQSENDQLVSICVPAYNSGQYITETLDSLINQTHNNIEIIVSDNASTDNTENIVGKYLKQDKRIRYYRNDENIGYANNIKNAVSHAKSNIIAIYHADDVYHPEIIARELSLLEADSRIGGVFAHPAVFSGNSQRAERKSFYTTLAKRAPYHQELSAIVGDYDEYLPILLEYGNFFACPSFMTRRDKFLDIGGFTERYPSNEDLELWIKYLELGWKLGIVDDYLLNYRRSENHASAYWSSRQELGVMYTVLDEMIVKRRTLSIEQQGLFKRNLAVGYGRAAFNAYKAGNHDTFRENLQKSRVSARLPLFSNFGIVQRIPLIAFFLKAGLERIKIRNNLSGMVD